MKLRLLTLTLLLMMLSTANAWWIKGHGMIAEAACSLLPDDMPPFFRAAGKSLNHMAGEPDRFKNKATPFLRTIEAPDHYIDLEEFGDEAFPKDRFQAWELAKKLKVAPDKAGFLPYALMEHFDKLTIAFADYRKDPQNEAVRMKCIIYAGTLSHYTGDCCMPLHTTRDYDGRPGPDGTIVQKGIHAKIDGFPENYQFTHQEIARTLEVTPANDPWELIWQNIEESRRHIEKCYEIDQNGGFDKPTDESRAFIMKHCRRSALFTAQMWYTAWKKSEKLPPPY